MCSSFLIRESHLCRPVCVHFRCVYNSVTSVYVSVPEMMLVCLELCSCELCLSCVRAFTRCSLFTESIFEACSHCMFIFIGTNFIWIVNCWLWVWMFVTFAVFKPVLKRVININISISSKNGVMLYFPLSCSVEAAQLYIKIIFRIVMYNVAYLFWVTK